MSNTISQRIFDFLKDFPPFNLLDSEDLHKVAANCEVKYLEINDLVFTYGDSLHHFFYIVKDGAVGLYRDDILVDHCDEGDVFGIRAILRNDNYKLKATAVEEAILYAIPAPQFFEIVKTNLEVHKYLIAALASNLDISALSDDVPNNPEISTIPLQKAAYNHPAIHCTIEKTVAEAAKLMTVHKVGSIIITNSDKHPLGIITDKDLRSKIATGFFAVSENVTQIMSSPVYTFSPQISALESQMAMMEHGISHLCITVDGTTSSEVLGMVSAHDIVVMHENNPSVLLKQIKRATTAKDMALIRLKLQPLITSYLENELPLNFITATVSSVNNSITKQIIALAVSQMPQQPPTSFTWLALGSQGRAEQLLFTDQDNAIIFEDVEETKLQQVKSYFVNLAAEVNKALAIVGFEECPANMMASNPDWCLSISEWKSQFNKWITQPSENSVMMCTIFFDFKRVYGDVGLESQLSESIQQSVGSYDVFLNYLGLNALQNPPPLSFFRKFIVEDSGTHHDQFDIKARAMMPLVDAARLLILEKGVKDPKSTLKRFEVLSKLEPQNEILYQSCLEAFETLLAFRTKEGLKQENSGRFVNLEELSKSNRLKLKQAFKPIKEIQSLIQVRFKLAQLM